ncbi:MAG: DUF4337 domain-containing protein [Gammaproteobacteria bacterium]|nr:DUF4337 domain-containing protein [Gammaproteobacteria bacterium]
MSNDHFHVHSAHEHEVEHQAHKGVGLAQYVAIFTAILSVCGAVISYQGSATQTEAMLLKNNAVLKKAEATDQWSFYQAKSNKGHLMELAMEIDPSKADQYHSKLEKYEKEKSEIKTKAEAIDLEAQKANQQSELLMEPHHRLAEAMTFTQIAIALASITILTRKRWLFVIAGTSATIGLMLWGLALTA